MSSQRERIAAPNPEAGRSIFSRIVTPLNVTLLAGVILLLPLIGHGIADILFFVVRPLTVSLMVIAAGFTVSLVSIVTGILSGLRVRFVALGPIQAQMEESAGWSIGLNRAWRNYLGSVLLVPSSGRYRKGQALLAAGSGLLASFAVAFLATAYARAWGWPGIDDPELSAQAHALLLAAPVGAVIVFLAESLTGGTVINSIVKGTPEQNDRLLANMTIASWMATGQRPSGWEPDLVEQAVSVPDSTADHLMGLCFAYLSAVDRGDLLAAERHLIAFDRWMQESSSSVRPYVLSSLTGYASLYHELAWLTAAHRRDLDEASEYLNRAAGFDVATPIDLRVKAEILALEGDLPAAQAMASEALAALDTFPIQQRWRIPFERDLLNRILDSGPHQAD